MNRNKGNHKGTCRRFWSLRCSLLAIVCFCFLLSTRRQTIPVPDVRNGESRYPEDDNNMILDTLDIENTVKDETTIGAFSDVLPRDWRDWLTEYSRNSAITIADISPVTIHGSKGCGISLKLLFQRRTKVQPIISTTKTFFKASYAEMTHFDAESHLREIKAYYLDRILKTNVVLPCVGYHLDSQNLLLRDASNNDKGWATIETSVQCANTNDGTSSQQPSEAMTNRGNTTASVEGSMMLWMYDLEQFRKEDIVSSTRRFNHSLTSDNTTSIVRRQQDERPEQESAMNYAIFHYLGACMKSGHNHFGYYHKKTNFGRQYVAIDNDRCMTPKAIFSNRNIVPDLHFNRIRLWETLVYEKICHVSHDRLPVLQIVREAAVAAGESNLDTLKRTLISNRLFKALKEDVLSYELTTSQPEAFLEIDERINKLWGYIQKNCPQQPI